VVWTVPSHETLRIIGRYALCDEIAAGGMATVHIGRLVGPVGFSRTVAIKRLHPQFAKDPDFVSMFFDEARLAARIRHANVVGTLDVVALDGEIFLVMDYVDGESLACLLRACRARGTRVPFPILSAIMVDALHGLHAAHEATSERGEPLHIVHRDVSPQNILVGKDGVARVLDFGVAKAADSLHTTRVGQIKGKLAYMGPEQVQGIVERRTDVYAAAVVLWEAVTGQRLFYADNAAQTLANVLANVIERPSTYAPDLPPSLEAIILRGASADPAKRFATAREMARALQAAVPPAAASDVSDWVESIAGESIASRARQLSRIEGNTAPAPEGFYASLGDTLAYAVPARRDLPRDGIALLIVLATAALAALAIYFSPRSDAVRTPLLPAPIANALPVLCAPAAAPSAAPTIRVVDPVVDARK
jgi:serine/threonine protein kinase